MTNTTTILKRYCTIKQARHVLNKPPIFNSMDWIVRPISRPFASLKADMNPISMPGTDGVLDAFDGIIPCIIFENVDNASLDKSSQLLKNRFLLEAKPCKRLVQSLFTVKNQKKIEILHAAF